MIYAATLILAACSLLYELLIAQALATFAANTVTWYSVTVGLYLAGMGLGALLHDQHPTDNLWARFFKVEIALSAAGAIAVADAQRFGALAGRYHIQMPVAVQVAHRRAGTGVGHAVGIGVGAMLVGASIGVYAARTVQMTQMPELVALMHSLVGLAAALGAFGTHLPPSARALCLLLSLPALALTARSLRQRRWLPEGSLGAASLASCALALCGAVAYGTDLRRAERRRQVEDRTGRNAGFVEAREP